MSLSHSSDAVTFDEDGPRGLGGWSCGCYVDSGPFVTGPGEDDWDSGPFTSFCARHDADHPPEDDEADAPA